VTTTNNTHTSYRPLAPQHTTPGASPDLFAQEYLYAIRNAILNSPRSLQKELGPSEFSPCARRIGYRLLDQPEREFPPNWKATVGTAIHMWLETAFDRYNLEHAHLLDGQERFYIDGSCDLYDRVTHTVLDHKTTGPTRLAEYRRHGPGEQYRTQAHLYGRGWQRAGLPVETVMIAFLPRNGELAETYIWHEPYDESIALKALERLTGIDLITKTLGHDALEHLPTTNHYCTYCPYFKAGSDDLKQGCPGDPQSNANRPQPTNDTEFLGL
jgi:hypothetical protein